MSMKKVSIAELICDPKNARHHGERSIAAIKRSLERWGQQKPIVITEDGTVVAGNGTLMAARQLGWTELNVVITKLRGHEAAAYAIADNRSAELSDWDLQALEMNMSEIDDIEALGFDAEEIDELFPEHGGGEKTKAEKPRVQVTRAEPIVRVVLTMPQVEKFEAALMKTEKINRAEALVEICEHYVRQKR